LNPATHRNGVLVRSLCFGTLLLVLASVVLLLGSTSQVRSHEAVSPLATDDPFWSGRPLWALANSNVSSAEAERGTSDLFALADWDETAFNLKVARPVRAAVPQTRTKVSRKIKTRLSASPF